MLAADIFSLGGVDPHTRFDLDVGFTRASDFFRIGSIPQSAVEPQLS
jgi:hypothetical protein